MLAFTRTMAPTAELLDVVTGRKPRHLLPSHERGHSSDPSPSWGAGRAEILPAVRTAGRGWGQVSPEDYRIIEGIITALPDVLALIEQGPMTMRKLRHILFGPKTEKTQRVCPPSESSAPPSKPPGRKRKGHGRRKARDYTGARWIQVAHPRLKPSYKTLNGARTGDLFTSLIHTCRLNGVNPFDYLLAIATHLEAVKLIPRVWLPWNHPKPQPSIDSS